MKYLFTLFTLVLLLNTGLHAQKRTETVYFDAKMEALEASQKAGAIGYEVRNYNRKGLLTGTVTFYDMNGEIIGHTTYNKKGEKEGSYLLQLPSADLVTVGQYKKNEKEGYWVGLDANDQLVYTELYESGNLIKRSKLTDDKNIRIEVSEPPRFEGGPRAWANYVGANLKYPTIATKKGIQGIVKLQFAVMDDGTVTAVKVLSSPDESLSKEALRIMKKSPNWLPGKRNGEIIPATTQIHIAFRLG